MIVLLPCPSRAQYLRLSMDVESELQAYTVRPIDFGIVEQGSGDIEIGLGSESAGIFAIAGDPLQSVLLNLELPDVLSHQNTSVEDNIPVDFQGAYTNAGEQDWENVRYFEGSSAYFRMLEPAGANLSGMDQRTVEAFVYIFGRATIGNIQPGIYEGDIILQVEYE